MGGGERFPLELSRALARHVACQLVTFGPESRVEREASGLTIQTLRYRVLLHGHPAHPVAPGLLAVLRHADIVHTHHMRSTPSRLAALGGRALQKRLAVTDHGLQGGDWFGVLPRLFDRFLMVSAYSARELHAPPGRSRVIYGGADPNRYKPDPAGRREGVLFVGRLTPHKGVDRLIDALPLNARLLVAGSAGHDPLPPESEYPALLRRLATGRDVTFLGPVSDDNLPALYRQAAVFVLPSVERTCYGRDIRVSELLGLVIIEAMASGTPVICSRLGGLPEIVEDGVTGFLVEPGNVEELRERLDEMLRNPVLAQQMGRRARESVVERFTWDACARRCLAAYQEMWVAGDEAL